MLSGAHRAESKHPERMLSGAQRAESKQESKDGPVPHAGTWTVYIIQCRSGKLYTAKRMKSSPHFLRGGFAHWAYGARTALNNPRRIASRSAKACPACASG